MRRTIKRLLLTTGGDRPKGLRPEWPPGRRSARRPTWPPALPPRPPSPAAVSAGLLMRGALALALTVLALTAAVNGPASAAEPFAPGDSGSPGETGARARAGTWLWPLAPPHPIVRPFEAPETLYSAGHRGIDLPATAGTAVFAPADGVVFFAGTVVDRPVLSLSHPGELLSSYEPLDASVREGERVVAGQQIGVVASGGHCADGCLHFGVRLRGRYVSPLLYLGGVPRAILLPMD
ncbi:M23 family metallopeptidase [Luethyella okanaganae]|uniref:M23 family metallopeptidase n=1 Tax=Luethyella okanaganae TaxID=69372 RepID=A0ABW1VBA9_9MICO